MRDYIKAVYLELHIKGNASIPPTPQPDRYEKNA